MLFARQKRTPSDRKVAAIIFRNTRAPRGKRGLFFLPSFRKLCDRAVHNNSQGLTFEF